MATKTKKGAETVAEKAPVIPEAVTRESIAIVEKKSVTAAQQAGEIVIKTDQDLEKASEYLSNLKSLQKFVKQEKDKRLNPVKETKSWIEGLFSPIEDRIEDAETIVKRVMATYHDKKTAEAAKKAASIAKQAEAGTIKPETAIKKMENVPEVKSNIKTTAGASTFSKVKKVRIVDPTKVPDAYWIIDEVTVRSAALTESKTQNKLGEVIPGVEVYEETIVGGRA